jgi:nucleoside-diphosphate-sugar epimerase
MAWVHGSREFRGLVVEVREVTNRKPRFRLGWEARIHLDGAVILTSRWMPTQADAEALLLDALIAFTQRSN